MLYIQNTSPKSFLTYIFNIKKEMYLGQNQIDRGDSFLHFGDGRVIKKHRDGRVIKKHRDAGRAGQ